jgi:hypothetical protein
VENPAAPSSYNPGPSSVNPAYILSTPSTAPLATPLASQQQFDWLKDGNSEPFAFLNANFDGSLNVDSVPQQWNQSSFWDDFGSFLVPQSNMSPFDASSAVPLESRLLFVPGAADNPMRRGVSLAEICTSAQLHLPSTAILISIDARVVESWLVGLPSTARDYARARIMALNDTNSMHHLRRR